MLHAEERKELLRGGVQPPQLENGNIGWRRKLLSSNVRHQDFQSIIGVWSPAKC